MRNSPSKSNSAQYGCAKCLYPITGLNGVICPECGNDLKLVGVRPLGGVPVAQAVIRRRVVFAFVVFFAIALLQNLNPIPRYHTVEQETGFRFSMVERTDRFVVYGSGISWSGRAEPTEFRLVYSPNEIETGHEILSRAGGVPYTIKTPTAPPQEVQGQFNAAAAEKWVTSLQDPLVEEHGAEAELARLLSFAATGLAPPMSSGFARSRGRSRHVDDSLANLGLLLAGLVLWLLLCKWFASRSSFVLSLSSIDAPPTRCDSCGLAFGNSRHSRCPRCRLPVAPAPIRSAGWSNFWTEELGNVSGVLSILCAFIPYLGHAPAVLFGVVAIWIGIRKHNDLIRERKAMLRWDQWWWLSILLGVAGICITIYVAVMIVSG